MHLMYFAHPFGGDYENVTRADDLLRALLKFNARSWVVISPLHIFPNYYEDYLTEPEILGACLSILERCDALLLAPGWEDSKGCRKELEFASEMGITIMEITPGMKIRELSFGEIPTPF